MTSFLQYEATNLDVSGGPGTWKSLCNAAAALVDRYETMALHTSVEEYTNFMDVDLVDFPDELLEVNDEFIDVYLKNVRGAPAVICVAH